MSLSGVISGSADLVAYRKHKKVALTTAQFEDFWRSRKSLFLVGMGMKECAFFKF